MSGHQGPDPGFATRSAEGAITRSSPVLLVLLTASLTVATGATRAGYSDPAPATCGSALANRVASSSALIGVGDSLS